MKRLPFTLVSSLIAPVLLSACMPPSGQDSSMTDKDKNDMAHAAQLKASGNLAAATEIYQQVAMSAKSSVEAEIELAAIDRKTGKAAEAVAVMRDAHKRQPDNNDVLTQMGYALIESGQSEEAVKIFDGLITINPQNANAYNGKGVAFDHTGNHLAAQDLYQQALKLSPDSLPIQNNMAMSLILNDQMDLAIAILEKLRLQYGDNAIVRHNLALAYGVKGDSKKALELNLKDLTTEEAKENQIFYNKMAKQKHRSTPPDALAKMHIGFAEPPAEKTDTAPSPRNVKTVEQKLEIVSPHTVPEPQVLPKPASPPVAATPAAPSQAPADKPQEEIKLEDVAQPVNGLGKTELPTSATPQDAPDYPSQSHH